MPGLRHGVTDAAGGIGAMTRIRILRAGFWTLVLLSAISGIRPFDRTTWLLEVFPVLIALPVLWATYRRFPLTDILYILIFLHAVVLIAGGAYSYARVPLGFHIADFLHLSRNPYDKVGHFFQGFVPALICREILLRGDFVRAGKMLGFIAICMALAIGAAYELLEWAAAVMLGQGADEFLGTQGDPWDTQSDMFCAAIGSSISIGGLSGLHDRQLRKLAAL